MSEPPKANKVIKEKKEGRTKARTQQTQEQGQEKKKKKKDQVNNKKKQGGQTGKVNACAPVSFSRRSR